jgi:NhaP-type Na+/H+ and K+/H+ antiporter
MKIIEYTERWLNTDLIQGKIFLGFSIILIAAIIIICLGNNLLLKGTLIPLILLALMFLIYSSSQIITIPKKLSVYTTAFVNNEEEFKTSEQARVKKLIDNYLRNKNYLKGLGLGLIFFGASSFVADTLLQRSATVYYKHLI